MPNAKPKNRLEQEYVAGAAAARWRNWPRGRVLDVALALGHDSPSVFATAFKRQFGQTPSEFFR